MNDPSRYSPRLREALSNRTTTTRTPTSAPTQRVATTQVGSPGQRGHGGVVKVGTPNVRGKSEGAQRKITEMQKIKYTPKETATTTPSKVYNAMGLDVNASSTGWDTTPIRKFDNTEVYRHPANNNLYILGPSGRVAQYQPNHNRLFTQVGSSNVQASEYPDWFDDDTIDFLEDIGGITSDPYYSEGL